jgi:integrase/recombinase XerC
MPHLSPTTLTSDEQALILHVTQPNLRDHVIYSLALGTGLRLAEIVGLNVCDLYAPDGTPRVRVRIRKEIAKGGRAADVFLPDRLVVKLRNFWSWKRRCGEDLDPDAPLFANQSGCRISKRRVQHAWSTWQRRAGFDRVYGFHALRHTAVTNVYRASRDLFLAQRFARHVSPLTTTVYTHPSDDETQRRLPAWSVPGHPLLARRADGLVDHRGGGLRGLDFNHQPLEVLVVELNNNCVLGMVDIPEYEAAVLVEHARSENSRNARPRQLEPLEPAQRRMRIHASSPNVLERNPELASQRPELVPALNFEHRVIRLDREDSSSLLCGAAFDAIT